MKYIFLFFGLLGTFFPASLVSAETSLTHMRLFAASGDFYIGNGGEGVITENGDIVLRDLYDNGIHHAPYFGTQKDPTLEINTAWLNQMQVSEDLVHRKLTDLNAYSPFLGNYVLMALEFYQWLFIDSDLTPVPNDGSPIANIDRRIPLANRLHNIIRLHRPSWLKLSQENRVALIFHEVISGLLRPLCTRNFICDSRSSLARDIVAGIFTHPETPGFRFLPIYTSALAIPDQFNKPECVQNKSRILGRVNRKKYETDEAHIKENRTAFFKRFCRAITRSDRSNLSVDLFFYQPSINVTPRYYRTRKPNNEIYSQMYASVEQNLWPLYRALQDAQGYKYNMYWESRDQTECLSFLSQEAEKWFDKKELIGEEAFRCEL